MTNTAPIKNHIMKLASLAARVRLQAQRNENAIDAEIPWELVEEIRAELTKMCEAVELSGIPG